jgi:hypothetical protein
VTHDDKKPASAANWPPFHLPHYRDDRGIAAASPPGAAAASGPQPEPPAAPAPPRSPPPRACKRLMWWTAVATRAGEEQREANHKYLMYLCAALLSAKANAPSLEPHLIYSGAREAHAPARRRTCCVPLPGPRSEPWPGAPYMP